MKHRVGLLLIGLLLIFVAVRLPGLSSPYQQDEFKTAIAVETGLSEASTFLTHPPLTALLYRADALVFGGTHMRIMPLLFGLISAVLLFFVARRRFNERTAFWALFLYVISFYGVWASLMLDTDGAILPTLFLAALYCYDRARAGDGASIRWFTLLALTLLAGFLVKLSFVLVVGALLADFLFEKRKELTVTHSAYLGAFGAAFIILTAAAFGIVKILNPAFLIDGMIEHVLYYVHVSGRNYLQVVIQGLKALFYLSPLLVVPLILVSKDVLRRATPFLWYLALGFVFYFILFDFSRGALDKYLMFTIIPLCVLSGAVLSHHLGSFSLRDQWRSLMVGVTLSGVLFALLFLSPGTASLYPKAEWFSRVARGDWNMLVAFNGGSGPVGFYVSFLFIICSFFAAGLVVLVGLLKKTLLPVAVVVLVSIGIMYNAAFIEEFSFGKVYGSVSEVLDPTIAYLAAADDIKNVNTHNDIGAYELKHIGKYKSHFTAAPQFESAARATLPAFPGVFLVIDIPPLYDGFYRDFFNSCKILFTTRSGVITSTVYSSCTWTKG